MRHRPRRPRFPLVAAVALTGLLALAGCAGDGEDEPAGRSGPPAARIDPNAGGPVVGPLNRARRAADNAEQRQQQIEEQTDQ